MTFELSNDALRGLDQNGVTDPIEFYKKPLIGALFRKRINLGLELLPDRRFQRVLEIGYGAGAVLMALAPGVAELHGVDLDAEPQPVLERLRARGYRASLTRGNVCDLPYDGGSFELAISFSVFEHLEQFRRGLDEVHRVLAPGGLFLLGMPAVNRLMEVAFRAIGFRGVSDHHVTTPAQVRAAWPAMGFERVGARYLYFPGPAPFGLRLYYNWLLRKAAPSAVTTAPRAEHSSFAGSSEG